MTLLTERLMVEALAERLAGLPSRFSVEYFIEPWRTCWAALDALPEGMTPHEKSQALALALDGNPDRGEIIGKILGMRIGIKRHHESMAELALRLGPIEWLWPDMLPRGFLTLFGAAQGSGKSFVSMDLAWRVINGQDWPDGSPMIRPGANVLYVDAEAIPQVHKQRAANYGVILERLFLMMPDKGEMIDLAEEKYRHRLVELVLDLEPELIIIDSLSSIHSRGQNSVEDVRELLGFLTHLAEVANCGVVLIHHIRKPGGGQQMQMFKPTLADLSGSGHITAMARLVWELHVVQTGPEADMTGPRHLEVLKNTMGRPGKKLGFSFMSLSSTPGEVVLQWTHEPPKQFEEKTDPETCADWLTNVLLDAEEPMRPADVVDLAKEAGFSRAALYRARAALGSLVQDTNNGKPPNNRWKWAG